MQIISSLATACIVAFCVFLVFFELMGIMWMFNVVIGGYPAEMNAVFVVNLVTSLGFGVEFCNHIAMNFLRQRGTRTERAIKAMKNMGSSVIVGIASTKFLGVLVLAFAPSTLFKLYYFRMYLCIILLGVFNGLFFLPVMLSLCGPPTVSLNFISKFTLFIGRIRSHGSQKRLTKDAESCGNQFTSSKILVISIFQFHKSNIRNNMHLGFWGFGVLGFWV